MKKEIIFLIFLGSACTSGKLTVKCDQIMYCILCISLYFGYVIA